MSNEYITLLTNIKRILDIQASPSASTEEYKEGRMLLESQVKSLQKQKLHLSDDELQPLKDEAWSLITKQDPHIFNQEDAEYKLEYYDWLEEVELYTKKIFEP